MVRLCSNMPPVKLVWLGALRHPRTCMSSNPSLPQLPCVQQLTPALRDAELRISYDGPRTFGGVQVKMGV